MNGIILYDQIVVTIGLNKLTKMFQTWYTDSNQSRSVVEDCVRLKVIIDALEFQLNEQEHRLISFKVKKLYDNFLINL